MIDHQTSPDRYKHWRLAVDGDIATLTLDVDETGGLFAGYELKLNSYDLGVDIELYDATQRLRFEHPGVRTVVVRSGKDKVFCAGANIRMLAGSTHAHKVNFCKFTNETRNTIEDATANSGQTYMAAVNGACAGGGYELALATDHILLADDGSSTVALPEAPLLAVLPGTGGLTRVTDKRKVRRDHADVFCTVEEGIKGKRALDWRLVDEIVPTSRFEQAVAERARALADGGAEASATDGATLTPLSREYAPDAVRYRHVEIRIERDAGVAHVTLHGSEKPAPDDAASAHAEGAAFWPLALARELDDAILHLRANEPTLGLIIFHSSGDADGVCGYDALLRSDPDHWFLRETMLYWKRLLKRIDVTSRTLCTLVEPGSCFAGWLAELIFAADRSYMLDGELEGDNRPPPTLQLTASNFGPLPMSNGLTRLETRFLGEPDSVNSAEDAIGEALDAEAADELGLVTFAFDDIDWEDEIRVFIEERASFSPDAMVGLEANLRFAGPETMETKIFGRLSAWQNWIFQRPNAVGEDGALRRYGTGQRAAYSDERV
ncbi:MAG: 2,3-epoxybenzoyl-CoA dihydrolase [Pseudomonadota bacterium]